LKHPVILTKLSVLTMAETMWPSYSEPKPRQICWRWDLDLRSFNCLSSRHNYYVNYWWQHFYKIWRSYDRSLVRCCTLCDWALWNFITLTFDLVTDALYHYVTPQVISRNEATQTHCYNPVAPAYLIWAYYAHGRQRRCHEDPVAPPLRQTGEDNWVVPASHGSAPSNRIWNITILRSPKQQIWLRTALCGGWCRRMALRNRELLARNDDDR